ncbi:MAG: TrkA family potassium uptake protein [Anaerolineales bacterium]|nr:TrkA family potassium uptake protein [Anaerolineales bacterium]MCS7248310.1 TrkA family potassium uptake protein [Anaerolineales bacterium]MDW8162123.1 TrkA family potassium uptake protein [Anaerolineales bacterium]MDW8447937.1 TrkA family potassium uptake protein [Anaerolineales bacterium]
MRWRNLRATWRDTLLLLREFRFALLLFVLIIPGAGVVYFLIARWAGEPLSGVQEAIFRVLALTFLEMPGDFPRHPALQMFNFLMPLIGIGLLATGLLDFGIMFFNRRTRQKEWEVAIASTFHSHIVLVGLGHLGFRVLKHLHQMGEEVVVIELDPDRNLIPSVKAMNIPVIQGDATRPNTLEAAGIRRAQAIVLCAQNDAANLQIAVKARSLNPNLRVVIRIFDDDFAQALEEQFGYKALSSSQMSAPTFAAAAIGADVTQPLMVEGEPFSLGRVFIGERSKLCRMTVTDVEQVYDLSVVMLKRNGASDTHPAGTITLKPNDHLVVFGRPEHIGRLAHDSRR